MRIYVAALDQLPVKKYASFGLSFVKFNGFVFTKLLPN